MCGCATLMEVGTACARGKKQVVNFSRDLSEEPLRNFPRNSSDGLAGRKVSSLVACPDIWRGQDLGKEWEVKFGHMKAAKFNSG